MNLGNRARTVVRLLLAVFAVATLALLIWLVDFVYPDNMPADVVLDTQIGCGGIIAACIYGVWRLRKR